MSADASSPEAQPQPGKPQAAALTVPRPGSPLHRGSDELFRRLVDSVRDYAIFVLTPEGVIATWNAGAERIKGYAASEAVGRHFSMFYPPAAVARGWPAEELRRAAAQGRFEDEGWRVRKDGSTFWANVIISPLRGAAGELLGYSKVTRDLSERRRIETLESEGRRIGEFIAMLSHELRNPLAPIRNAVALLQQGTGAEQAAWCLNLIGRQTAQLARLVDDLLDVSRLTGGKFQLRTGPLEFGGVVRHAADAARPEVDARGHRLKLRLAPTPMAVVGDETRLTQVVVNLLHNAAKYTPDGGAIAVTLDLADGHAVLRVADNGVGMTPALLQTAFDPFVQGARGQDRSTGGLGVGLTLVKSIVELHGGSVVAASAGPGQGATFTVTLPLAAPGVNGADVADAMGRAGRDAAAGGLGEVPTPGQPDTADRAGPSRSSAGPAAAVSAPASASASASAPLSPPAPASAPSPPPRVLVVDDNVDAAESLALLLRLSGHRVDVAHDGAAALRQAAATSPQVVLLDLGLPDIDGYEVARRLRAQPALRGLRLIAVTGFGQASDRDATAAAGFVAHLTKPIDPDEVTRLIGG